MFRELEVTIKSLKCGTWCEVYKGKGREARLAFQAKTLW
jgi:hypothetical protein